MNIIYMILSNCSGEVCSAVQYLAICTLFIFATFLIAITLIATLVGIAVAVNGVASTWTRGLVEISGGVPRGMPRCSRATSAVSQKSGTGVGWTTFFPLDPRPQRQQLQAVLCVYTYRGGHTHRGVVQLRTGLRGHTGQKETPPLWTGLPCLVR